MTVQAPSIQRLITIQLHIKAPRHQGRDTRLDVLRGGLGALFTLLVGNAPWVVPELHVVNKGSSMGCP